MTGRKSIYPPSAKFASYERLLSLSDQVWKVEGVPSDFAVSSPSKDYKFFVYMIMLDKLLVRPPFTLFQREILRWLRISPSLLHPNSWAFVLVFEIVMQLLNRPCSAELFFTLFEVVHQVEKRENDMTRYRWVSLEEEEVQVL